MAPAEHPHIALHIDAIHNIGRKQNEGNNGENNSNVNAISFITSANNRHCFISVPNEDEYFHENKIEPINPDKSRNINCIVADVAFAVDLPTPIPINVERVVNKPRKYEHNA